MVYMKDIANACGVSVSTVSKALNDHNDIGSYTKKKICETAKSMGYYPDAQARALKLNRTYNLGILDFDDVQSGLKHEYYAGVLDSFKRTAEKKGYDITFINCVNRSHAEMSILERCHYRGFDGVVICCAIYNDPQVVELIESDIPVVTIDYVYQDIISVSSDNVSGMRDLVTHIFDAGHERVAYIHGEMSSVTRKRLTTFFQVAEEFHVQIPDNYIKHSVYRNPAVAAEVTLELLDMEKPPTCIVYSDDHSAYGGIGAIKSRGLRIPEDISVAGYDGLSMYSQTSPKLTTVTQDTESLGRIAAEQLIGLIENPKKMVVKNYTVKSTLIPGETVDII